MMALVYHLLKLLDDLVFVRRIAKVAVRLESYINRVIKLLLYRFEYQLFFVERCRKLLMTINL